LAFLTYILAKLVQYIDLSVLIKDHISNMKKILYTFATLSFLAIPQFFNYALAASGSLTLSSASSVTKGSSLTFSLYETSDVPVNGVKAVISYPADKFDFVSISNSSAFSVAAVSSGGGGTVRIDRGALSPVSGKQLVATFRLKAKVDSGTGAVSVDGSSAVVSSSSSAAIAASFGADTVTFKPVPPPTPEAPTPPADTIAPVITAVKVSDVTATAATVTWTTSEPANSEVDYGLSQSYGLSAVDGNLVTDHKMVLNSPLITPGTNYHMIVKSADGAGNAASSPDSTFKTDGVALTVVVKDDNGNPVEGAVVTFGNISATTDKDGKAVLNGLTVGTQSGTISYKGNTSPVKATINLNDPNNPASNVNYKIKRPASSSPVLPAVVLIALIGLAVYLFKGGKGGGPGAGSWKDKLSKLPLKRNVKTDSSAPIKPSKPSSTSETKQQAAPSIIQPTSK
jgi:hypothetical protein